MSSEQFRYQISVFTLFGDVKKYLGVDYRTRFIIG